MATRAANGDGDEELCRVQFVGGPLSGATLDLPVELADVPPGRLVITAGGTVFDRYRSRPVLGARIIEPPGAGQPPEGRRSRSTVSWRSPFL